MKFLEFTNTKISNNDKLLYPFLGENLPSIKLLNLIWGGDNLAGHCFVYIKKFNSNQNFQISHDC